MHLRSISMTLPWYPAHDSLWETMKKMGIYNQFAKIRLLFCFVQRLQPEGWISQVFTGWYNSTVLKMPIPAFIELEGQLDMT